MQKYPSRKKDITNRLGLTSPRGGSLTNLLTRLKQADTENRPIYLESSSASNTRYYKRFGFEVKREIALTRGPVPVELTVMVREPQAEDLDCGGGFGGFGVKA